MIADRAHLRRLGGDMNMSAVSALPDHNSVALENLSFFESLSQQAISRLMLLLNLGNAFKQRGNLIESLIAGILCKTLIHVTPLVVLTFGGPWLVGYIFCEVA